MKMRYGTAGDCYSLNNCPQGIFSIYLENTDFQVSPKTKWKGIEPKSSVKVDYRVSILFFYIGKMLSSMKNKIFFPFF